MRDGVATALFRIVQEALNNVVKHAHAKNVLIRLDYRDQKINLTIQDDGNGLKTDTPLGGLGWISMRERALAFDGLFSVTPNVDRGVTVRVEIPMHTDAPQETQL
jgi:signal transduction histidine kinase